MDVIRTVAVAALAAAASVARAEAPLLPRAALFGPAQRASVRISPDGTMIAMLAPRDGVPNVRVERLDGREPRWVTRAAASPITSLRWAENARQIIYEHDASGEGRRLFAVDIETGDVLALSPAGARASVLATDASRPDELLVRMNADDPARHDVHLVDTRTGARTTVFRNDGGWTTLVPDRQLRVRAASRVREDGSVEARLRDGPDQPWYQLVRWTAADAAVGRLLGFARDGTTLYLVDARGGDTARLFAFTPPGASGEDGALRPLAGDDRADAGEVVFDPATGRPQAVAFAHLRRRWEVVDPDVQGDWSYLATVADGDIRLESRDRADERWIVSYERDTGPREYYLYHRPTRRAEFLFSERPDLAASTLAAMTPVVIPARDGLELTAYVTRPPAGAGPWPAVLLVHGGPWTRDHWGFDPLHQWLANRGYAVLSVNFRGSAGFGKSFLAAGDREWAGRMQDDLVDAVNWAVSEGIADPDRVAIMGASYGGYAALVGLARAPEFYVAGVDLAGPVDIGTLVERLPEHPRLQAMFAGRVARADEPAYLESISPLSMAGSIRRPLLVGHGGADPRVPEGEVMQLVGILQSNRVPVTAIVFPGEGHGFERPASTLGFLAAVESFLGRHLGGRVEPTGEALQRAGAVIAAGAEHVPGL